MSFVTRRNSPAWGPNPRAAFAHESRKKYSEPGFFLQFVATHLIHASLGFLSSLHCTPPLLTALPALTGQPAHRPITEQQKSVPTNQSRRFYRGCTGHTIVLGLGCIPSKADLFEHHRLTWTHEPHGQVTSKPSHLAQERKGRDG